MLLTGCRRRRGRDRLGAARRRRARRPGAAMRVVGMISGTSMDGIDVAVADLQFVGDTVELRPLGATSQRVPGASCEPPSAPCCRRRRRRPRRCAGSTRSSARRSPRRPVRPSTSSAAARSTSIVSHGQTIFHWVDADGRARGTLQLGQPAWIAEATGVPVVADVRARDIAAGGHGAPLASTLDELLLAGSDETAAALNLGGIANITVVARGAPTHRLRHRPGQRPDRRRRVSTPAAAPRPSTATAPAAGAAASHADLLERLLAEPYYRQPPPKSTGKELFHVAYLLDHVAAVGTIEPDDLVATVTALTAITVADACREFDVRRLVVSGGGVDNPALMERLGAELPGVAIAPIDDSGSPPRPRRPTCSPSSASSPCTGSPAACRRRRRRPARPCSAACCPAAHGFPDGRRPPRDTASSTRPQMQCVAMTRSGAVGSRADHGAAPRRRAGDHRRRRRLRRRAPARRSRSSASRDAASR